MVNVDKIRLAIIGGKPRTHSYGFAQLYLNDSARLHLFDAEVCEQACIPDQVSVRHNHRYSFRSTVLNGCIIDQPCAFVPWRSPMMGMRDELEHFANPWFEWEVQPAHEGELGIRATGHQGYVIEGVPRVVTSGHSYDMEAGAFHATAHIGTTLSLFKREAVQPIWSKLIVPPGQSPVHSLNKQPSSTYLITKYLQALSALGAPALKLIEMELNEG